jgi:hypothetical protein
VKDARGRVPGPVALKLQGTPDYRRRFLLRVSRIAKCHISTLPVPREEVKRGRVIARDECSTAQKQVTLNEYPLIQVIGSAGVDAGKESEMSVFAILGVILLVVIIVIII